MEKLVTLNNLSTFLDNTKEYILDLMYPVGSVYISVNNTNPQNLWGGMRTDKRYFSFSLWK